MIKLTTRRRAASSSSSSFLNRKLLLSAGSCVLVVLSVLASYRHLERYMASTGTNGMLLFHKNSSNPSNSSSTDAAEINKNGKVVSLPNGELPFYHYIPVKSDFSDLGIMIDWARKNDDLVQEIIRHSTEYIENLLVSEEAKAANDEIIRRMVRLYSAEFGDVLSKCKGPTATLVE